MLCLAALPCITTTQSYPIHSLFNSYNLPGLRLSAAPFRESNFVAPDHCSILYLLQPYCICLVLLHYDCLVTSSSSTLKDCSTKAWTEVHSPLYSQILAYALIHLVNLYLPKTYQVSHSVWGTGNRNMYQTVNIQDELTTTTKKNPMNSDLYVFQNISSEKEHGCNTEWLDEDVMANLD